MFVRTICILGNPGLRRGRGTGREGRDWEPKDEEKEAGGGGEEGGGGEAPESFSTQSIS